MNCGRTHAAPHPDGLVFTGDEAADGAYGALESATLLPIWSDCLDGGKLTVWCFGHAPHPLDFTDSGVRFVCNPRGRPGKGDNIPYSVQLIDTSALTATSGEKRCKKPYADRCPAGALRSDISG